MYRVLRIVPALLVLLLIAGLTTNTHAATNSKTVTVKEAEQGEGNYVFSPKTITINVGDTVVWKNTTDTVHTSTSNTGVWDSGDMHEGDTFSFTFKQAGTYQYYCHYHRAMGMVGTVIVKEAPGMPSTGGGGMASSTHASNPPLGPIIAAIGALLALGALFAVRARRA